jgi:hypothetical protein
LKGDNADDYRIESRSGRHKGYAIVKRGGSRKYIGYVGPYGKNRHKHKDIENEYRKRTRTRRKV